jgi:hypothetical protein
MNDVMFVTRTHRIRNRDRQCKQQEYGQPFPFHNKR